MLDTPPPNLSESNLTHTDRIPALHLVCAHWSKLCVRPRADRHVPSHQSPSGASWTFRAHGFGCLTQCARRTSSAGSNRGKRSWVGNHQDAASLMTRTLLTPCLLRGMLVVSSNVNRYALETRHAAAAARGTRDAQRDDVADHMTHRRFVVSQRGRRRGLRSAGSGCEAR